MTPEPAQPSEAWLNDPASLESGEPEQPAESPEARAILSYPDGEPGTPEYEPARWVAASTARPTERGAVEAHFARMQDMMRRYVEPCTYVASFPNDSSKWESEFEEPGAHDSATNAENKRRRMDRAFIADMIRMMDGPEQRALALPATDQAAEVAALRTAILKRADECQRHAEASFYPKACSEYRAKETAFREAAALATQPATGRTMGGEERRIAFSVLRSGLEAAKDANDNDGPIAWSGATSAISAMFRKYRAALQNGGE